MNKSQIIEIFIGHYKMRKVSFIIVGLTNSGKSSLINEIAG